MTPDWLRWLPAAISVLVAVVACVAALMSRHWRLKAVAEMKRAEAAYKESSATLAEARAILATARQLRGQPRG